MRRGCVRSCCSWVALATMGLGALACDPPLLTDQGQVALENSFHAPGAAYEDFASGDPVVAGTRFCPAVRELRPGGSEEAAMEADADDLAACFDVEVDGALTLDPDGCLEFAASGGAATWRLLGDTCELAGETHAFTDDGLQFEVAPAAAAALDYFWVDRLIRAQEDLRVPADAPAVPPLTDGPFRVAGPSSFMFYFLDDGGRGLHWAQGDVRVDADSSEVSLEAPYILVEPPDADAVSAELRIGEQPQALPIGPFERASLSEIASLELVPVFTRSDDVEDAEQPAYARALVRDAEGRVLHGAPVEWTLGRGALAMTGDPFGDSMEPGAPVIGDFIGLADACVAPPTGSAEERSATITASVAGVGATLELEWRRAPGDEGGDGEAQAFEPSPLCQEPTVHTCACTSEGARPSAWGLVLLLPVFASRRRRRA